MTNTEALIVVLEESVKRNGEKPLTNAYLLNIVKMAARLKDKTDERLEQMLAESMAEDRMWGK
jgi:hypothetical protein